MQSFRQATILHSRRSYIALRSKPTRYILGRAIGRCTTEHFDSSRRQPLWEFTTKPDAQGGDGILMDHRHSSRFDWDIV